MLEAFGLSDAGCVRSNNEDYYLLAPSLGLFLVADGMGGAAAGASTRNWFVHPFVLPTPVNRPFG